MFLDARGVAEGATLDADLCIVGAGAAGITIARELRDGPLSVLVLESGGLLNDARTQDLARGEIAAHAYPPLESARVRVFGGSTTHWNGWCRPLDPIDFEHRPTVAGSGWPIDHGDLDPYYARAQTVCQLGPYDYDQRGWADAMKASLLPLGDAFETSIFQFSPPTNFGRVYRQPLARSRNVRVLLHANVTRIATSENGANVERLNVATLSGRRFHVRARRFVIACGGIDNARLLLASEIGDADGPVGRFFAEHPHAPVALAVLPAAVGQVYTGAASDDGTRVRGALATRAAIVRDQGLLQSSMTFDPFDSDPYVDRHSVRERGLADFGLDVGSVQGSLEDSAFGVYALYTRSEQAPNPSSRVTLAEERDALDVPRARLEWRLGELDRLSLERTVALLGETLGRNGIGRVFSRPATDPRFIDTVTGGYHHMGTTRMGLDRRTSVVDRQCRVHGVDNLFIAGSSVFATSGYANPTLTIVALALRLADHLAGKSTR